MSFDYFKKKRLKKIEEFEKYVRPEFLEKFKYYRENNIKLSEEDIPERMNGYESNLFMEFWNNELLIERAEYYIGQAFNEFYETDKYIIDGSYDEVLKHKMIHMLLKRLKEK